MLEDTSEIILKPSVSALFSQMFLNILTLQDKTKYKLFVRQILKKKEDFYSLRNRPEKLAFLYNACIVYISHVFMFISMITSLSVMLYLLFG